MNPSMFALVHRSLRVDSRSVSTYVLRSVVVFFGLLGVLAAHNSGSIGEPGLEMFKSLVWVNMFLITIGSGNFFGTVITEEKEDMTLGLLRMTGLSPLNILLGKSAGRLISALLLLFIQIPLVVLAVSFGGASIDQVLSAYAVLGAYVVFMAGIGVLASVVSKSNKSAAGLILFLLILIWFMPVLTLGVLGLFGGGFGVGTGGLAETYFVPVVEWFWSVNPYLETGRILRIDYAGAPTTRVIMFLLGVAVGAFLAAWAIFRKVRTFDQGTTPGRSLGLERLTRRRKSRVIWAFPVAWKDFYYLSGGRIGIVVKSAIYLSIALGFGYLIHYNSSGRVKYTDLFGGILCNIGWMGFVIELGVLSGRIFRDEIKWQTLSGLVTLPRPMPEWIFEKVCGCALSLIPAFASFVFGALIVLDDVGDFLGDVRDEPGFWVFCLYVAAAILLTNYLSLFLRWGALAAAGSICVVCGMIFAFICFQILGIRDEGPVVGFAGFAILMAIVFLLIRIPQRLRVLAAQ